MKRHPDEEGDPDRALNQLLELTRKNLSGEQPASAPNPVKNTKKGIGTKQLIIAIAIFFLVINIGLLYFLNKKEAFRKAEEPTEENTSEVYNLSDYAEMLLAEGFTAATGEDIRTLDLFSLKWTIVNQKLYYFSTVNNSPGADDYLCAVLNDNTIQINDYKGPEVKELVIPEIIDGLPVTVIGNSCFKNDKFLEKVTIPDTVDYIDVNAFTGCTALKKLFFKKHHCH